MSQLFVSGRISFCSAFTFFVIRCNHFFRGWKGKGDVNLLSYTRQQIYKGSSDKFLLLR